MDDLLITNQFLYQLSYTGWSGFLYLWKGGGSMLECSVGGKSASHQVLLEYSLTSSLISLAISISSTPL